MSCVVRSNERKELRFCDLYNLYFRDKLPAYKVGDLLGCEKSTVLRRIRGFGLKPRHHNDTKKGKKPSNTINISIDSIMEVYSKDWNSVQDVAKHFNVSRQVVDRILRENGIEKKPIALSRDYRKQNHPSWNPNKTEKERVSGRYDPNLKLWADRVKEIAGYRCQKCGDERGGNLVSHHINPYWKFKELRTDLSNGACLCESCHKKFHNIYGWKHFSDVNFKEFMADD